MVEFDSDTTPKEPDNEGLNNLPEVESLSLNSDPSADPSVSSLPDPGDEPPRISKRQVLKAYLRSHRTVMVVASIFAIGIIAVIVVLGLIFKNNQDISKNKTNKIGNYSVTQAQLDKLDTESLRSLQDVELVSINGNLRVSGGSGVDLSKGSVYKIGGVTVCDASGCLVSAATAAAASGNKYTAGNGLSLTDTAFSVNSPTCASTDKLTWTGTAFTCASDEDSGGTITNITTGTGLSGGPISTTGTIDLADTTVTAGTYGDSGVNVTQFTVDQQGRLTAVSNRTLATASASTTGVLSTADWTTFNGKENVLSFNGNGLFSRSGNTVTGLACLNNQVAKWSGSAFNCGSDSDFGVNTIGTIDSQTKSANGAVISGSSLVLQTADATNPGLVSTGTQTLAGNKTLTGSLTVNNTASFKNSSDSTGAFTIQNLAGDNQVNLNNVDNKLTVNTSIDLTRSNATTISTAVEGTWTMNSNAFTYRRTLTITNQSPTQTLPVGYEVTVTLNANDSAQVFDNTRGDQNDFRIAHNSTETARNITSWTSSNVTFTFLIQADIPASTSDSNYYLYYKNPNLAVAGQTFTPNPALPLDNFDDVSQWVSSDAGFALSNEATIKQEGTGSVKQVATGFVPGNIGAFSTVNQGQLPAVRQNHTTVTANIDGTNYIYVLGGNTSGIGPQTTVYKATIDSSGNIGTFATTSQGQLPLSRGNHTTVTANIGGTNYIYVLGGNSSTTVYKATIDSSGNIGTFATTSQGQLPAGRNYHTTVTANIGGTNYIYVLGGSSSTTVYKATIDSSGNIGTFATTSQGQLPLYRNNHTTVTANIGGTNYIYVLGGESSNTAQITVWRATIDSSGNIGAWSTTSQGQLTQALERHTTVTANIGGTNYIYVLGGTNSAGTQYMVYRATIDSSGNIGAFSTSGQVQMSAGRNEHTTVIATVGTDIYTYVLGGVISIYDTGCWCWVESTSTDVSRAFLSKTYSATKTFATPVNLSTNNAIRFGNYSSRTGSYMAFEFSEDGTTWQTYPYTVNTANLWESKVMDISAIPASSRDGVTQIRFRVTDPSTTFTAYTDDISAPATPYTDAVPLIVSSAYTWGQADLKLNAQGTGAVTVQYGTGGSGGLAVYDGTTTPVFSVSGNGDTLIKTKTNSTVAFQVQDTGATNTLLTANTTNNRVVIGDANNTSAANSTLFVVDSASTTNLPTGVNGGIVYDLTTNKLKVYENSAYKTLCNTTDLGCATATSVGTIDSQTKSANGAVISGTSVVFQTADASFPGLISTGTQTFAGNKTFNGNLTTTNGLVFSSVADSASAIGLTFNTPSYVAAGAKLVSFQNNSVEKFFIDKDGNIVTYGHIKSTQATAPTVGVPTNCGTSPTATVATGSTDSAGSFTINAGTDVPANCSAVITFNRAYGVAPKSIILSSASATGTAKDIYVSAINTTTFTVIMNSAPAASEVNTYYYWAVE